MLFRIPFKGRPYETQYLYIAMQILWLVKKKKKGTMIDQSRRQGGFLSNIYFQVLILLRYPPVE